ncbi:MAG TPA: hypothetical protein VN428_08635 [Bryobacteraceae bacterium]|nr:hypothetical protein [Bryobacteraceae bacterium]
MIVRIRLRLGPAFVYSLRRNRELASFAAALMTPAAVAAFVLGVWRLASDLEWAGAFVISHGLFSHWQVWIAMAGLLQTCASALNRFGRGGSDEASA